VAVHLSDSFVIEKLASAMQLLLDGEDHDEDCATVQNAADKSNEESTSNGATHCTLLFNGNTIEVTWKSVTEKHLLTWDTDGVATFIQ
jgi:hypothetical protein